MARVFKQGMKGNCLDKHVEPGNGGFYQGSDDIMGLPCLQFSWIDWRWTSCFIITHHSQFMIDAELVLQETKPVIYQYHSSFDT